MSVPPRHGLVTCLPRVRGLQVQCGASPRSNRRPRRPTPTRWLDRYSRHAFPRKGSPPRTFPSRNSRWSYSLIETGQLDALRLDIPPPCFGSAYHNTVNSTTRAAWSTRARSSGVIEPRSTIPSSVASVLLIKKSCGVPIFSGSRFSRTAAKHCGSSQPLRTDYPGFFASEERIGASAAVATICSIIWLIVVSLG